MSLDKDAEQKHGLINPAAYNRAELAHHREDIGLEAQRDMLKDQILDLVQVIKRLKTRIQELEDIICEAAPQHWVFHQDMEGAKNWEVKASQALKGEEG